MSDPVIEIRNLSRKYGKREADDARSRFRKIHARFKEPVGPIELPGAVRIQTSGRDVEVLANGNSEALTAELKTRDPKELRVEGLSLEEIFVASQAPGERGSVNARVRKEVRQPGPALFAALFFVFVQFGDY